MSTSRKPFSSQKPHGNVKAIDWDKIESSALQTMAGKFERETSHNIPTVYEFNTASDVSQELYEFRHKFQSHFRSVQSKISELEEAVAETVATSSANCRHVSFELRDVVEKTSFMERQIREQKQTLHSAIDDISKLSACRPQSDQSIRLIASELENIRDSIPQMNDAIKKKVDKSSLEHITDAMMKMVLTEIRMISKIERNGVDLSSMNNDSVLRITEHSIRNILMQIGITSSEQHQGEDAISHHFPPSLSNSLLLSGIESCIASCLTKLKADVITLSTDRQQQCIDSRISEMNSNLMVKLNEIELKMKLMEDEGNRKQVQIDDKLKQIWNRINEFQTMHDEFATNLIVEYDSKLEGLKSDLTEQMMMKDDDDAVAIRRRQQDEEMDGRLQEMIGRFEHRLDSIESNLLTREIENSSNNDDDTATALDDVTTPVVVENVNDDDVPSQVKHSSNSIQCTFCLRRMDKDVLNGHLNECELRTEPCPHRCGQRLLSRNLAKHLEKCSNTAAKTIDQWSHQQVSLYLSNQLKLHHVARKVMQFKVTGVQMKNMTDEDLADSIHGLGVTDEEEREMILSSMAKLK